MGVARRASPWWWSNFPGVVQCFRVCFFYTGANYDSVSLLFSPRGAALNPTVQETPTEDGFLLWDLHAVICVVSDLEAL